MAEEPKQGEGIGELFVEFGAKGLPTLLKGLNTVSASFLLGKNAANQFIQTITKPAKEAGHAAVEIGKMSSALGVTYQEALKLQLYFKSHNLSEGLLNDLASTSDMLTKVQMGIGGISGEFAYAMHSMGLNWMDYNGSLESTLQLTKDVQKATEGMESNRKRVLLQSVGLNPEWSYAFERGDLNLADYKNVSDKEVQDLIISQEAMANLAAETDQLKMHLVNKLTPAIVTISNGLSNVIGDAAQGSYDKAVQTGEKVILDYTPIGWTPLGSILKNGRYLGNYFDKKYQGIKNNKTKGQPTGGAAPVSPTIPFAINSPAEISNTDISIPALANTNPAIPPNISNKQSANIYVTNENNINVANPQDAGPVVSSISQETLTNIEYSGFQVNNRPGL